MRTIRSKQRIGEDLPETVLRFDAVAQRVRLDGTRQDFEVNNLIPMIFAALGDAEMTEEEIFDILGHGKTGAKRPALRSLLRDGTVERSGGGKKSDPYRYRKARSHVPTPIANTGNENSQEQATLPDKMLVPNSSFLYRNEETRICDREDDRLNPSEMLVPEKSKDSLFRDSGERAFPTHSDGSDERQPAKSPYREIVL